MKKINSYRKRIGELLRILLVGLQVRRRAAPAGGSQPVIFFNASTRISGTSLNSAFALVASWVLRMSGTPVIHFVCRGGMSRCVLGTDEKDLSRPMPCRKCALQSRLDYAFSTTDYFSYHADPELVQALEGLDVAGLMRFEHPFEGATFPAGKLVLPSMRWRLRRMTLADDEPTRGLYREFILSAWNILKEFERLLRSVGEPPAVVIFNALQFPEATVNWLAKTRGIRVISHEVGMAPESGFFTDGDAPTIPIPMPPDFQLTPAQEERLDILLQKRFGGQVSMGGIYFYPEMKGLDEAFLHKAAEFKAFVPIFTNVIFDTTQDRANILFPNMFAWLDELLEVIRRHPETLFVLRAHPDEFRPGKTSQESVAMWVERAHAQDLPNFFFIPPDEFVSSYELMQRSKFVIVYNSTVGLEASILGKLALAAGSARFTGFNTLELPLDRENYLSRLEALLGGGEISASPEHTRNARRFLYFAYYRSSLPFNEFIEPSSPRGYVRFKPFRLQQLLPATSVTARVLLEGILHGGDFTLPGL